MSLIDQERVTPVLEEVSEMAKDFLNNLFKTWNSMYEVTSKMEEHGMKVFLTNLKDFFQDILQSEEEKKINFLKEIELKVLECKALEKALQVKGVEDDLNFEEPLTTIIKKLDNTLQGFEDLKKERMIQWNDLREKEKELCTVLGFKTKQFTSSIPCVEDIEDIENFIFSMQEEKINRSDKYKECCTEILNYINKLEVSEASGIMKHLEEKDENNVLLTDENMQYIINMRDKYAKEYEGAKIQVDILLSSLRKLWNRIDINEKEQNRFIEEHQSVGKSTMQNIKREINRCEILKKELLTPLIAKVEKEIIDFCDKLTFTDEQKTKILSYRKGSFTEDVLDLYELELEKLKFFYSEHCEILELAQKRNVLWERMLHLEEVAKDKTRLFNNRGGQLLKEEKERKSIDQHLPKITAQLQELLEVYQEKNGKPFVMHGENLLKRITYEWQQHLANKENKKLTRKVEQRKQIEEEARLGVQNTKRKAISTPKSESKRLKLTLSSDSILSTSSSLSKVAGSASGSGTARKQDLSCMSYSFFENQLEQKKVLFAVKTPERVKRRALKEVNSPVIHSSPKNQVTKTPMMTRSKIPKVTPKATTLTPRNTPRRATPGRLTPFRENTKLTPAPTRFRFNI